MDSSMSLCLLRQRWKMQLTYRGRCLRCQSERVWYNGIRWRSASLRDGDQTVFVTDIPVRRLQCGECSVRWSRAPEGVPTRAHYQPCVVSHAVLTAGLSPQQPDVAIAKTHRCHRRTLLRFIERLACAAPPAELLRRILQESDAAVIPSAPPPSPPRRSAAVAARLQRALWVLGLLDILTSLLGLPPPGLSQLPVFLPAHVPPTEAAK